MDAVVLQSVQLRSLFALRRVQTGFLRVATAAGGMMVGLLGRRESETRLRGLFGVQATEEKRTVKAVVVARLEKNVAQTTGETVQMIDQLLIGTHHQFVGCQHRLTFGTLRKRPATNEKDGHVFHLISVDDLPGATRRTPPP